MIAGNCDDGTTIVSAHNTQDKSLGYLIRIDGRLVEQGGSHPASGSSGRYEVPLGESHFYRIRLGLPVDHVYFSDEAATDGTNRLESDRRHRRRYLSPPPLDGWHLLHVPPLRASSGTSSTVPPTLRKLRFGAQSVLRVSRFADRADAERRSPGRRTSRGSPPRMQPCLACAVRYALRDWPQADGRRGSGRALGRGSAQPPLAWIDDVLAVRRTNETVGIQPRS